MRLLEGFVSETPRYFSETPNFLPSAIQVWISPAPCSAWTPFSSLGRWGHMSTSTLTTLWSKHITGKELPKKEVDPSLPLCTAEHSIAGVHILHGSSYTLPFQLTLFAVWHNLYLSLKPPANLLPSFVHPYSPIQPNSNSKETELFMVFKCTQIFTFT